MTLGFTLQDKFGIFIAAIITLVIPMLSFFFYNELDYSLMRSLRTDLTDLVEVIASRSNPIRPRHS